MGKTQTFSFNSNNSRNKKNNEYKKPFFRWKSWLQYMNLKKIWGILGLWFSLSVIFLSAFGVSIWQIIANAAPVFNTGIVIAFILLAIIVLPIGLSFLFWGIFKIVLWTAKRTDVLYIAQKLLLTAICLNFFFIFFLASINKKEDNLSDTKNFNIRKQKQTNTYNYNPTYGNETRTFSLTSQFTAENDQSATKHYTTESQSSTSKSNLYDTSYQQNQQTKPTNSQSGFQQPTQIFDINPQAQPQQPTQSVQSQSNSQPQNTQTFNTSAQPQQPVPPRNPQPNFQQPQAQPQQNTQAFNIGMNQPQRPMGPQQPMPPRG
ncbi:hypothetical protein, partial [Mycoplasmopsis primatum]|uniref:hypothetical protein n=1 Tax=Mycoplasmopsis primatum TaxID=55604 RepID=UPI000497C0AD